MPKNNVTNRRDFLKLGAIAGGAGLAGSMALKAAPKNILSEDRFGVLVDTTVCVGCRNCEWACKEAHGLANKPLTDYADRSVFKDVRRPNSKSLTVVNEFKNPKNELLPINVKCNVCTATTRHVFRPV